MHILKGEGLSMELTIKKRPRVLLSEGGIPFCEVSISLPEALTEGKAAERIARFYGALEGKCLLLAKEVILPYAKRAYEESTDPRRRFTHRPYRLELSCRPDDGGIRRCLTVTHRGRTLFQDTRYERIDEDGRVLPYKKTKIRA